VSEQVRVNGVPLLTTPESKRLQGRRVRRTHAITLAPGENVVEVSSFNTRGVESPRAALTLISDASKGQEALYFVGLGVSDYADPGVQDLSFAHQDIEDVHQWFQKNHEASGFAWYVSVLLTEEEGVRAGLEAARRALSKATEADTVVVMVSGHGTYTRGEDPRYVFLGHDTKLSDLEGTAITLESLEDLLVNTKARRRLVLMDTCQSGDLPDARLVAVTSAPSGSRGMRARAFSVGLTSATSARSESDAKPREWLYERRFINRDLAWRTGAMVLSSSTGFESSWEDPSWRNGAFTEALLEALDGAGDTDGNRWVSVRELDTFVRRRVPELTENRQHPTLDRDNPALNLSLRSSP
jgi:hypothetical protein